MVALPAPCCTYMASGVSLTTNRLSVTPAPQLSVETVSTAKRGMSGVRVEMGALTPCASGGEGEGEGRCFALVLSFAAAPRSDSRAVSQAGRVLLSFPRVQ